MNPETTRAWRAWRRAAERGYGSRDNTLEHMRATDKRIANLKAKYEALAREGFANEQRHFGFTVAKNGEVK